MNYADENTLFSQLTEEEVYLIKGDMMDNYNEISFQKKDNRLYVVAKGGEFLEPYIWNFSLQVIDILADDIIEIDKLDHSTKQYLQEVNLNDITLDEFKEVENTLNFFFTKFDKLPIAFKELVKLPN